MQKVALLPEVSLGNLKIGPRARKNFVMVGRWSDYKGFDIGLDIFQKYRELTKTKSNLELWCSGAEDIRVELPGVVWRSAARFDWADLLKALPNYRAVLLPYRSATQSGVQVLAWHLAVPCLISDLPGLVENQPPFLESLNISDYPSWFKMLNQMESDSFVNEVGLMGMNRAITSGSETEVGLELEKATRSYLGLGV